jgi:hypothetical protein
MMDTTFTKIICSMYHLSVSSILLSLSHSLLYMGTYCCILCTYFECFLQRPDDLFSHQSLKASFVQQKSSCTPFFANHILCFIWEIKFNFCSEKNRNERNLPALPIHRIARLSIVFGTSSSLSLSLCVFARQTNKFFVDKSVRFPGLLDKQRCVSIRLDRETSSGVLYVLYIRKSSL